MPWGDIDDGPAPAARASEPARRGGDQGEEARREGGGCAAGKRKADSALAAALSWESMLEVRKQARCAAGPQEGQGPAAAEELLAEVAEHRPLPSGLTEAQVAAFQRDGYVLIRGLVQGEELEETRQAVERWTEARGQPVGNLFGKFGFALWTQEEALRRLCLDTASPSIAAELMGLQAEANASVRLLKDAVLSFGPGQSGCGWHVDDEGFWPTSEDSPGPGVNVWISLAELPAAGGGGLAVVPGSHKLEWCQHCREAIAGSFAFTCAMAKRSPECQAKLEEHKVLHDLRPGDALVLDRWLFHRTEPFRPGAAPAGGLAHRYSIRYMPSEARLVDTAVTCGAPSREPALLMGAGHGDSLERAGALCPRVWPAGAAEERRALSGGLLQELEEAAEAKLR